MADTGRRVRPFGNSPAAAVTLIVHALVMLCGFASALPYTLETNERLLLENFAMGWTKVGNDFRITLRLVGQSDRVWIGIGTSQGLGVGSPLMTTKAAAVIAKPGALNVGFDAIEYELLSKDVESGILPWATTGPSPIEISRCVQRSCPTAATRCQSRPACVSALQCASASFTGNGTAALTGCAASLGDGVSQESIDSIGAFLDTAGCYFTNCAADLQRGGIRPSNIKSVTASIVQNPGNQQKWNATLTFTADRIGHVALNDPTVTIIAAWGIAASGDLTNHGPSARTALTLDLNTNTLASAPVPAWVQAHAAIMTVSLGIMVPIGVGMKIFGVGGHAFVQLLAIALALIGVGYAAFFVDNIGSKGHHVLGVITVVLFVLQPIGFFFRPSDSSPDSFRRVVAKAGDKRALLNEQDAGTNQAEAKQAWGIFHRSFGYTAVVLAVANSFLGAQVVEESQLAASGLSALPIVFAVFAGLAILAGVLKRVYRKLRPARKEEAESGGVLAISSNPNFDNKAVKAEDVLEAASPADEGELKVTPCYLVFKYVSYRAPLSKKEKGEGASQGKSILNGCSGFCAPGTLTAIMGPSGSGKTSLLDTLAGRARHQPESSTIIEVNGVSTHLSRKMLSRQSGYVLQEDILHQYLTVFETLMNTARLILPVSFTPQQRYDRVMRVIAQLGLGHAVDTKIGGPEVRGLSGGERRRVSVGIQIIKSPSLLFLDEPTSGLDSSTAAKLVQSLRDLANEGRTVVATIHQPSVQIYDFFDRLVLLSAGRVVWSGTRTGAESFFLLRTRPVPPKWNPADWFLLVVDVHRSASGDDVEEQESNSATAQLSSAAVASKQVQQVIQQSSAPTKRISYKLGGAGTIRQRPQVKEGVLRMSVAAESRNVDVAMLTEIARQFYATHNPEKLKQRPEIVDEVVKYGMRKGVSELDRKLQQTYGVGILAAFQQKQQGALVRSTDKPWTMSELDEAVRAFEHGSASHEIETRLKRCREEANASGLVVLDAPGDSPADAPVSLGQQIRVLTERGALLAWRDPQVLRFQAIQNLAFGLVLGSLYSNLRNLESQAYTLSMAMAIILGIVAMITIALGTAVAFSDKQVFVREQNDYMYSPVAHFFARLFVGAPINLVIAGCLILPSYWWIGLEAKPQAFFFFFGVNIAMIFLFDGVVGVVVFLANDVTTAFGMGNFYEAISIFMSGIFIPYPLIPPFWAWLFWITPFSYAYAAVAINEFEGTENEFWLYAIGIVWLNKWGNLLVIIVMGVLWRLLGLVLAIRVNRQAARNVKPKSS